ncbi:anthocyanidin reductase ((2S)-flavan-3-ol-forming)-like isoform X2 [Cynara cardunculus var. scolymus]|uniref:anthocyanidin reductase ((2S)-flavan-3-ol-forming)-like isoform X2 n=1 Tax=Cynara cardunculus var. scolymus TaxID=59895 RepID=UPI000D626414|nr:anthocyanidin reductase ((2S)-flavan-3-ol-forming)-like isoform X2 [Cynara cardunculus var. scolymus]
MNLEMESKSRCKVCVTGGAGYIGSALVHSLLQNGYTVHATLRNLGDESKVGLLRGFPDAEERLHLFEADIYRPQEFEEAIQGCVYVFHLATPIYDTSGYKYNDKIKATISAVKKIVDVCIQSRTVKRLIYTASVVAASPLKDDGSGYKTTMDESCWTPFHINVPYSNDFVKEYTEAKTRAEQEILKIGEDEANELEVVTLSCGLVGGRGHLLHTTGSVMSLISQVMNDETQYQILRYLEELMGKIPIVHIEDVCRAHIFCVETPMVNGRFLCSSSYITSAEMAKYYQENYPQFHLKQEYFEGPKRDIKWGSRKLEDEGFSYKHDAKTILDDCIEYARRSGNI